MVTAESLLSQYKQVRHSLNWRYCSFITELFLRSKKLNGVQFAALSLSSLRGTIDIAAAIGQLSRVIEIMGLT